MDQVIMWFEIPVKDIKRAKKFYEEILRVEMTVMDFGGHEMAFFPSAGKGSVSGALCKGPEYNPSTEGALIYLNGNPDLDVVLGRVPNAGGVITLPKREISPEYGYMAMFMDTEGNRIALHSVE
ncbi:VOC family protein [Ignavibacteriales bacterium]